MHIAKALPWVAVCYFWFISLIYPMVTSMALGQSYFGHRSPVNSPHKGPVTRKMFPFDDVIMDTEIWLSQCQWRNHGINEWNKSEITHSNSRQRFSYVHDPWLVMKLPSNIKYKTHQIPKPKFLSSRLEVVFCPNHWNQVLSREWRCSWSSAARRCSNYIWEINNFIACQCASYITGS